MKTQLENISELSEKINAYRNTQSYQKALLRDTDSVIHPSENSDAIFPDFARMSVANREIPLRKARTVALQDLVTVARTKDPQSYRTPFSQEVTNLYAAGLKYESNLEETIKDKNLHIEKNKDAIHILKEISKATIEEVKQLLDFAQEQRDNAVDGAKENLDEKIKYDDRVKKIVRKSGDQLRRRAIVKKLGNKYTPQSFNDSKTTNEYKEDVVGTAFTTIYHSENIKQKILERTNKLSDEIEKMTGIIDDADWCITYLRNFFISEQGLNLKELDEKVRNQPEIWKTVKNGNANLLIQNVITQHYMILQKKEDANKLEELTKKTADLEKKLEERSDYEVLKIKLAEAKAKPKLPADYEDLRKKVENYERFVEEKIRSRNEDKKEFKEAEDSFSISQESEARKKLNKILENRKEQKKPSIWSRIVKTIMP